MGVYFMSLYTLKKNFDFVIEKMPKNELLQSMGVREGLQMKVLTRQPFGGPIIVKLRNRNIAIDKNIAELITVKGVN